MLTNSMSARQVVRALIAITMLAPVYATASGAVVELRSHVNVKRDIVTLGDVAQLSTEDLTTIRRLNTIYLGRAPKLGQVVNLESEVIRRWVNSRVPDLARQLQWRGAHQVTVSVPVQELSSTLIGQTAQSHLRTWLTQQSDRAEMKLVRVPKSLQVPEGEVEIKPHPFSQSMTLQKRMTVWLEVWTNQRFVRLVPVEFEVGAFKNAYVFDQSLNKDAILSKSNLVKTELDLTIAPRDVVLEEKLLDAAPLRVKQSMKKGDTLTARAMELKPVAIRGEWLTLIASTGAILVESKVEALQDGAMGQWITVRAKDSKEVLKARVIAAGKVEVTL
ncbi:flagellar basal body P-ring formation chaperone FlgA [Undibacterium flavidum]|uniref:Flagellar basal body P-ring formation protein FlgA n=1 Tax=Undibacterium flavidum TaxID=2762297 RepID=A0ABR6YEW7_9BURK|nr:flagellar basal body P-ring formation chaperone FlgA [Undibacterium flavidum]MBC3875067.1 flagellar basal body P-ring formation protein FlgA [Undibacterium flavidum]